MSFLAPRFLLLAGVIPLLWWWLARRRRAVPVEWPSLTWWPEATSAVSTRKRSLLPPVWSWPLLAAILTMVLALAEPVVEGAVPPRITAFVDVSASMGFRPAGGEARWQEAARRVREALHEWPGETEVIVREVPGGLERWRGTGAPPVEVFAPVDGLALEDSRVPPLPEGPVWWIADRFPAELPRNVTRLGVGREPVRNVGIVSARLDPESGDLVLVCENFGDERESVNVVWLPDGVELAAFALPPRSARAVLAPRPALAEAVALRDARDELRADDEVFLGELEPRELMVRGLEDPLRRIVAAVVARPVLEDRESSGAARIRWRGRPGEIVFAEDPGPWRSARLRATSELPGAGTWNDLPPLELESREVAGQALFVVQAPGQAPVSVVARAGARIVVGLRPRELERRARAGDARLAMLFTLLIDAMRDGDAFASSGENLLSVEESSGHVDVLEARATDLAPSARDARRHLARALILVSLLFWGGGLLGLRKGRVLSGQVPVPASRN